MTNHSDYRYLIGFVVPRTGRIGSIEVTLAAPISRTTDVQDVRAHLARDYGSPDLIVMSFSQFGDAPVGRLTWLHQDCQRHRQAPDGTASALWEQLLTGLYRAACDHLQAPYPTGRAGLPSRLRCAVRLIGGAR
jgi:hypothetical protein